MVTAPLLSMFVVLAVYRLMRGRRSNPSRQSPRNSGDPVQ